MGICESSWNAKLSRIWIMQNYANMLGELHIRESLIWNVVGRVIAH